MIVVGEAGSPLELTALLQATDCDVLLTDFMMPFEHQNDGLKLLEQIRRHHPQLPVLVVTMLNNAGLFRAMLALGMAGVLDREDTEDIARRIRTRLGLLPITPEPGLAMFDKALATGHSLLMTALLDRDALASLARSGVLPPVLREIVRAPVAARPGSERGSLAQRLEMLP